MAKPVARKAAPFIVRKATVVKPIVHKTTLKKLNVQKAAKLIVHKVTFPAPPKVVYELLMDSDKHAECTGASAAISQRVGGLFSAYDGYISGKNIELVPGKKIVQEWQAADWKDNEHSTAVFELKKTKEGTLLLFTQAGVPERFRQAISDGWYEHYWEKMKAALGQKRPAVKQDEEDDEE